MTWRYGRVRRTHPTLALASDYSNNSQKLSEVFREMFTRKSYYQLQFLLFFVVFCGGAFADPCSECRRRVNNCWEDQQNMSSVTASMSMISTCSSMQSTCNDTCNYSIGTSPGRYNYGSYDCRINCLKNCNMVCNYSFEDYSSCISTCRYEEQVCIATYCQ